MDRIFLDIVKLMNRQIGKSMELNDTLYGDTKSMVYLQWGLVEHVPH